MRALLVALGLSPFGAQAMLLEVTQSAYSSDGALVTLTAFLDTQQIQQSPRPYDPGVFINSEQYMDIDFAVAALRGTLRINGHEVAYGDGYFSIVGDMAPYVSFDAAFGFSFDDWSYRFGDASVYGVVTAEQFAAWTDPIAGFFESTTFYGRVGSVTLNGERVGTFEPPNSQWSLTVNQVPEPATLGLFGLGLLCVMRRSGSRACRERC